MARGERPSREELTDLLQRGFRYALSLTHDRSRAEDLVQDAWTSLLERDDGYHAGYLFATIRNRFIDQSRRLRLVSLAPLDEAEAHEGDEPPRDEEAIVTDRATIRQALSRLGPDEREALYLFAVEGYGLGEIARLTGRPEGTVSSLVTRARQRIRRAFGIESARAVK
jgi:RNA polymerase sigma-70 factor (ECF subfamily)